MMRLKLDINGVSIGEIGVWNTQEYNNQGEVRYQVHDLRGFRGDHISDAPHITDVWHDRSAGASELTAVVMDAVPEDRLDNAP